MFVGWLVDFALRMGVQIGAAWIGLSAFFTEPDLARPAHLTLLLLLLGATLAGGLVAGRLSDGRQMLAGLLVGATGVLAAAVSNPGLVPVPPLLVLAQALSLAAGALGGGLAGLAARRRQA